MPCLPGYTVNSAGMCCLPSPIPWVGGLCIPPVTDSQLVQAQALQSQLGANLGSFAAIAQVSGQHNIAFMDAATGETYGAVDGKPGKLGDDGTFWQNPDGTWTGVSHGDHKRRSFPNTPAVNGNGWYCIGHGVDDPKTPGPNAAFCYALSDTGLSATAGINDVTKVVSTLAGIPGLGGTGPGGTTAPPQVAPAFNPGFIILLAAGVAALVLLT
jgi:hypothetical protein